MKVKHTTRMIGAAAMFAASLGLASPAGGTYSGENSIKAAFVYNIAKLTTWPSGSGPLVVGIIGSSGAGDAIATVIDGKDANGRAIQVKKISAGDAKSCQIVFVCGTGGAPSVAGSPVLTIGEAPGFATSGGAIGFAVDDGKVRIEINMGVVKKAGLKLSDKLVSIGKTVG